MFAVISGAREESVVVAAIIGSRDSWTKKREVREDMRSNH